MSLTSTWDPTLQDNLRTLWAAGLPIDDIAAALGRTRASVSSKATHLRLPRRLVDQPQPGDRASPAHEETDWRDHSESASDAHLKDLRQHHPGQLYPVLRMRPGAGAVSLPPIPAQPAFMAHPQP